MDLVDGYGAAGHEVIAYLPGEGPLAKALEERSIPVRILPRATSLSILQGNRLRKLLAQDSIEVAQTHGLLVNLHGRYARALGGPPHVGVVHRALGWGSGLVPLAGIEKFKVPLLVALDRATARFSAATIAVSSAVQADLLSLGLPPEGIRVVPNGIPDQRVELRPEERESLRGELGVSPQELLVFTAARLSPLKDLSTMIQAVGALGPESALRLRIAGAGPEEARLQKEIEAGAWGSRIALLGRREDCPRLLAASDIFALSSRTGEGLPIALLEAMRQGLPSVVTREAGTMAAAQEGLTSLVSEVADPAGMTKNLGALEADPVLFQRLSEGSRRIYLENYRVQKMVAGHLEILERAANFEEIPS